MESKRGVPVVHQTEALLLFIFFKRPPPPPPPPPPPTPTAPAIRSDDRGLN